jgi:hypothetical protein
MSLLLALTKVGRGVAVAAAMKQAQQAPRSKGRSKRGAPQQDEGCSPCQAGAYVESLRKGFGGPG